MSASTHLSRLLWALTGLFALRIVAQPLSLVVPALPTFDAWHGSTMPYPLLLAFQLVILAIMIGVNRKPLHSATRPKLKRTLILLGQIYFVGMLVRLVLGQVLDPAPDWFNRPLPTLFHLVLATWLLITARRLDADVR